MAKKKVVIGSVVKSQKDNSFYVKVKQDVALKTNEYINLENEAVQLAQVQYALEQGWIDEKTAEKRNEQVRNYWNEMLDQKDGKPKPRKDIIKYQLVVNKN